MAAIARWMTVLLLAACGSTPDAEFTLVTPGGTVTPLRPGDTVVVPPSPTPAGTWWNRLGSYDTTKIHTLNARESQLTDWYFRMRKTREANVALVATLKLWEHEPEQVNVERAEKAFVIYKESAMGKYGGAIAVLFLAGCSSVASEIRALNAEEKELMDEISRLQNERKAIIGLAAALAVWDKSRTPQNEENLEKARAALDQARAEAR